MPAFIEIEPGTHLLTGVFKEDAPGRVQISDSEVKQIARSLFGHAQFMYIDGALVENADFVSETKQALERNRIRLARDKFAKEMGLTQAQMVSIFGTIGK